MSPEPARTISRVEVLRSRQLMRDSQALIAHARELLRQSRWIISQQTFLQIVCAWCQETIRFERSPVTARGQVSHSICYDCFVPVFQELTPVNVKMPNNVR